MWTSMLEEMRQFQFGNEWQKLKWYQSCGPFYEHRSTLIPARISKHMPRKVWDEITYPFLNFNGATVEV